MGKHPHNGPTKLAGRIVAAVYALLVLLMGVATFVGQARGATFAATRFYGSWWFASLWALLLVLSLYIIIVRARMWKHPPLLLLHLALGVILLGAGTTRLTAHEGTLHLREGGETDRYITADGGSVARLPFTLRLDSFRTRYYPGTDAPADFVSYLQGDTISMNRPLRRAGYRLYQAGFDPDGRGTRLSVTYDPWGTPLTYAGYALLALAMMWVSLRRRGGSPRSRSQAGAALLLCLSLFPLSAAARSVPTVSAERAAQTARMPVVWNGRVAPFNTLAREAVRKVYGRDSYKGLRAEQVVLGWAARPDAWKDEPLIQVKDRSLRRRLGIAGTHATMAELFTPAGEYRVAGLPPSDKAVRELDEKVGLLLMLTNGTLVQPAPPGAHYSRARFEAELRYNAVPFTRIGFMACLAAGLLALLLPLPATWRRRGGGRILAAALFAFVLCGYALRWYVGGRVPLGNGSETMQFLALCTLGLLLVRTFTPRRRTALRSEHPRPTRGIEAALLLLIAGFALLVSWLGERNPQVTALVPVLNSPLLSLHVSVIMASYALLALTAGNSLVALVRPALRRELQARNSRLLRPAVFLLAAGIFIGAVWANVSWGSYWSWDPKETWALITLMVYAVPLHTASLPALRRPLPYHAFLLLAFLCVLMTYFGVNYFLGGMHSYA